MVLFDVSVFTWGWFNWSRSSSEMLRSAEEKILSRLRCSYHGRYVNIGSVVGKNDKIWMISLNEDSSETPIVLLHGMGAGVALWCLNLDVFASTRPVYAIDILGFGRSSRPDFSSDAREAEDQLVRSFEAWRRELHLENFCLLGHSMGGFLAASYAIEYPEHVKHLILADPWGFSEKPPLGVIKSKVPVWVRAIAHIIRPLNPLWIVRAAGPFGQWLIKKTRRDVMNLFTPLLGEDTSVVAQYIHQCNAQTPSGESAFHAMMEGFAWAKFPMLKRMNEMVQEIPITFLYGIHSWVEKTPGVTIKQNRAKAYVNVQIIPDVGHHVYAVKGGAFNENVLKACAFSDTFDQSKSSSNDTSMKKTNNDLSTSDGKNGLKCD